MDWISFNKITIEREATSCATFSSFSPLLPEGYHFGTKKGRKWYPFEKGYHFRTLSQGHTFFLIFMFMKQHSQAHLGHWDTKIVPLRAPYYEQSNSTSQVTVSIQVCRHDTQSHHQGYNIASHSFSILSLTREVEALKVLGSVLLYSLPQKKVYTFVEPSTQN